MSSIYPIIVIKENGSNIHTYLFMYRFLSSRFRCIGLLSSAKMLLILGSRWMITINDFRQTNKKPISLLTDFRLLCIPSGKRYALRNLLHCRYMYASPYYFLRQKICKWKKNVFKLVRIVYFSLRSWHLWSTTNAKPVHVRHSQFFGLSNSCSLTCMNASSLFTV